jgi:hypothetical protein
MEGVRGGDVKILEAVNSSASKCQAAWAYVGRKAKRVRIPGRRGAERMSERTAETSRLQRAGRVSVLRGIVFEEEVGAGGRMVSRLGKERQPSGK